MRLTQIPMQSINILIYNLGIRKVNCRKSSSQRDISKLKSKNVTEPWSRLRRAADYIIRID